MPRVPANSPNDVKLTLEPIGYVRTALTTKVEAARQPRAGGKAHGRIELIPGRNFEDALRDLDAWDHIWVLYWFDRNLRWRPKVLPPRSRTGRKGVFATRSPHRPNPLGLSAVELERVDGLTLHVRDIDMLDGTPVLDLKPYVAYTDAIADARSGWLEDAAGTAAGRDPIPAFAVHWDEVAACQADWIEARTGLTFRDRATATLALGPTPHAYRRIRRAGDAFVLALKEWRARFTVAGRDIRIHEVASGFRASQLAGRHASATDLAPHREFRARFAQSSRNAATNASMSAESL